MGDIHGETDLRVSNGFLRVGGHTIPLTELSALWHRRGARARGTVARRSAIGLGVALPLLLGAGGVVAVVALERSAWTITIVVAVAALLALASIPIADLLLERMDRSYARGTHTWEIWGRHGNTDLLLMRTHDRMRFGQVYRALSRALERHVD